MAAPKPIIDLMLYEKYGWTPQEVDDIPKVKMDEMMLVLNMRLNVDAEVKFRNDAKAKTERGKSKIPTIGDGRRFQ